MFQLSKCERQLDTSKSLTQQHSPHSLEVTRLNLALIINTNVRFFIKETRLSQIHSTGAWL